MELMDALSGNRGASFSTGESNVSYILAKLDGSSRT
jgi:hypothetical protein